MSIIIGISGYARSGKDTVFELLEEFVEAPYKTDFERLAFADELKQDMSYFISQNFSINVWNPTKEEKPIIRPIMVEYGKAKRKIDELYWVNEVTKKIKKGGDKAYVITDLRYENEAIELKKVAEEKGVKFFHLHVELNGVEPANEEEKKTIPPLEKICDFHMKWKKFAEVCDVNNEEELNSIKLTYAEYIAKIIGS